MGDWTWRYERTDGAVLALTPADAPATFPSQADAESWIGEEWKGLLEAGVDAVTLLEDDRVVYGPMSLHPAGWLRWRARRASRRASPVHVACARTRRAEPTALTALEHPPALHPSVGRRHRSTAIAGARSPSATSSARGAHDELEFAAGCGVPLTLGLCAWSGCLGARRVL